MPDEPATRHKNQTENGEGKTEHLKVKVPRNAEQTRARIIAVATLEFAEKGYDGARIEQIVERCCVSKNLIYHYFEGKEALFVAVLELAYRRMRERQREWSFAGLTPLAGIETLVTNTFDHFVEDPTIIGLLNTENLHHAKHISQVGGIRQLYVPLLESINEILDRGRRDGLFRADVDPVDLYISIAGLSYFYLSNASTLSFLFNDDLLKTARLEQRKNHIVSVILGYLKA